MGLKALQFHQHQEVVISDKIRPKWDWKFCTKRTNDSTNSRIKSDQNGIESENAVDKALDVAEQDKIRPKWDWKFSEVLEGYKVFLAIKSDQNGIERKNDFRKGIGEPYGIKSDQNGIESDLLYCENNKLVVDKIRPKWDWKGLRWSRRLLERLR